MLETIKKRRNAGKIGHGSHYIITKNELINYARCWAAV
jgi:hypothetical protein